jgi:hypothetical protein
MYFEQVPSQGHMRLDVCLREIFIGGQLVYMRTLVALSCMLSLSLFLSLFVCVCVVVGFSTAVAAPLRAARRLRSADGRA